MVNKMKVILISSGVLPVYPKGYGGLEAVVGDLAVCLDRLGHEVYVVCQNESDIGKQGNIIQINCGPCNPNAKEWESKALELCAPIIMDMPDAIIHDHTWTKPVYLLKRDNPGLHVMSTLHGMLPYQIPPPVDKPCMAGISQHHAETIRKGLTIDVRFVYNGVDLDRYVYGGCSNISDKYLFLARMTPFKGAHVFFSLMQMLGLKGDLVGDDQMVENKEYVSQLMQACVSYPDVRYWGGVSRERAVQFFRDAKAYILPCDAGWQEPFGLTVVEAMACGCPVIATASGAIPELVEEGATGFVVPDANGLPDLLKSGKIESIKPEDCRKRAEMFSREAMAEGYIRLYEDLLNGMSW